MLRHTSGMAEHEPNAGVGLNPPPQGPLPAPTELQFQRAEPVAAENALQISTQRCVACQQLITGPYYHAQGQVVCPTCAERIQSGQQAPPAISLVRGVLYGAGAALGGCILYATVAIVTGLEFGLMAIVVGIMVGKAIRYASHGLGGRTQQVLAVTLTYFAITTSYIPVIIYHSTKASKVAAQNTQVQSPNDDGPSQPATATKKPISVGTAFLYLFLLALAAPFLSLTSGISGLISLVIIFFGLLQAWKLTGRTDILVMGPYASNQAS
jgi:uncharacterized paraquat-inducible protein A